LANAQQSNFKVANVQEELLHTFSISYIVSIATDSSSNDVKLDALRYITNLAQNST